MRAYKILGKSLLKIMTCAYLFIASMMFVMESEYKEVNAKGPLASLDPKHDRTASFPASALSKLLRSHASPCTTSRLACLSEVEGLSLIVRSNYLYYNFY